MSNTQLRIISAVTLITITTSCLLTGIIPSTFLLLLLGIICLDELTCNFSRKKRFSFEYCIIQVLFILPFSYLTLFHFDYNLILLIVKISLVLNLLTILYLFFPPIDSKKVINLLNKYTLLYVLIVLPSLLSLSFILYQKNWQILAIILLLLNGGMDIGAWFFGKFFGKRKLCKKISPNKTIEGLIGGAITAGILSSAGWYFLVDTNGFKLFFLFLLLGLSSQVGDLIQSKLKRQFEIKDSSKLIPGHGGFYDRIDGLLFLSPFYTFFISFLNI